MLNYLTDAHAHISADYENLKDMQVSVSACFKDDWLALAKLENNNIIKAFGVHPSSVGNTNELLKALEPYLVYADAIGEMGLDKYCVDKMAIDSQEKLFEAQISLSKKYNLPIIIHCVGQWGALCDILKKSNLNNFLIHSSKCSPELVKTFEKLGGYFSFGLRELNSKKGKTCAESVCLDRILVESDAKSNRKIISETIKRLSEIKNLSESQLTKIINKNFNIFYKR